MILFCNSPETARFSKKRAVLFFQYLESKMPPNYQNIITMEQGKRGGKPCIRNLRITVYDVLSWLSQGMKQEEIIEDFPELTTVDINACLAFAAERERHLVTLVS
jgi:uncharacterized protein (DUF433 family)